MKPIDRLDGLFAQATFLGAGGGIGNQQQRANDAGADGIHDCGGDALGKDKVGGFLINEDIEHRGNQEPGNYVADNLNNVEGEDFPPAKCAVFHVGAAEGKAIDEAGDAAGYHPAPPGRAILHSIAEGMADESNQRAGDWPKQRGEERGDTVSGLEAGFRNG